MSLNQVFHLRTYICSFLCLSMRSWSEQCSFLANEISISIKFSLALFREFFGQSGRVPVHVKGYISFEWDFQTWSVLSFYKKKKQSRFTHQISSLDFLQKNVREILILRYSERQTIQWISKKCWKVLVIIQLPCLYASWKHSYLHFFI